jgi:carbon storage regulator CsrA
MLVLTRKSQEAVVVGGFNGVERMLKVIVLEVRGGKVKLGFEIDAAVPVHRSEVWERIRAEHRPCGLGTSRAPTNHSPGASG